MEFGKRLVGKATWQFLSEGFDTETNSNDFIIGPLLQMQMDGKVSIDLGRFKYILTKLYNQTYISTFCQWNLKIHLDR